MGHSSDLDLTRADIAGLSSPDALAAFFTKLGYDTGRRTPLTAEAVGLTGDSASPIKQIELLSEDSEGFLRVVFAKLRSLTAKSRNDLVRVLGQSNVEHLLILASNFQALEFVLITKPKWERRGRGGARAPKPIPVPVGVDRNDPTRVDLRILRRMTWTCRDGLEQYDKLRSVFEAAAFTEKYFVNLALFSDHYLTDENCLRDDAAWKDENPSTAFAKTKKTMEDANRRWSDKGEAVVRAELFKPVFRMLGFSAQAQKPATDDHTKPDYLLRDADGGTLTAAFVYAWDRWLDGQDIHDPDTPNENPGASVITALKEGVADWIIVTNGRLWRLYSRRAHARSTNFYEVDLAEALLASGDTDPNEAFRYWWLFFRADAFRAIPEREGCWLDTVVTGSREYAKRLSDKLKDRIFVDVFPKLASGFLYDRKKRLGKRKRPDEAELQETYEATLTLLYRLLFLLYSESRELLPVREAPYNQASMKRLKEEVAEASGDAGSAWRERIEKAYSASDTKLYDRLTRLFQAMDKGDPGLNVPQYNGGLFITRPGKTGRREDRIAAYLKAHKVPDRFLALAVDLLARAPDEKTDVLGFIDYKSLEVRHLGSIYEGLLEFKLAVAAEDLTTKTQKKKEKYVPLSKAKKKHKKKADAVVRKGEVFLSNDKAERRATGSYYTPDPIVEYIVQRTVGPVLDEKLTAITPGFRKVRRTFDRYLKNAEARPVRGPDGPTPPREFAAEKTYHEHRELVDCLFDFRVLDPAMGSAHFLVESVDFITDRLLHFLNQFPVNPVSFMLEQTRRNILESLGKQEVTVDPAKLTDVHLLKRHVLKRCIYGVDINPMAVELAKVSLWLDAFTLGAPLSFLDHHLRWGNSLVGASFAAFEEAASKNYLLKLDYEPLMRAINCVVLMSKLSDATAAEVEQSASEYDRARKNLEGYQVLLDLLVAKHFGEPDAPFLVEQGCNLDLETRSKLMASLKDDEERELVERVEQLAARPGLCFFHWDIEFPEVFFDFADANHRLVKHRDEIRTGSAGFDAVVGNPPYVRQEAIKKHKGFLREHYGTYNGTNDLYVYFQEGEVRRLRVGGRMGMIVANKWMRAAYGSQIRKFLMVEARPAEIVDFGHSPVFPDADTFPCVLIVERRTTRLADSAAPPDGEEMRACRVPRESWHDRMDVANFVRTRDLRVPTSFLGAEPWSLEDPLVLRLLDKVRNAGPSLAGHCGTGPMYGVKTGYNDAFMVGEDTMRRLKDEDPNSSEIIKPVLRGRDIRRWHADWARLYVLFTRRGIDIDRYPAVKKYLLPMKRRLTAGAEGGRKPGSYKWYELQDPVDYYRHLDEPKVIVKRIAFHSQAAVDEHGHYVNDSTTFIPTADGYVAAVLNSRLMWWYMTRMLAHKKDEALAMDGTRLRDLPIAVPDPDGLAEARALVSDLTAVEARGQHRSKEFQNELSRLVGLPADDDSHERLWAGLSAPPERFRGLVERVFEAKVRGRAAQAKLTALQANARLDCKASLTEQLSYEKRLGRLVEDAYGLTAEERELLRATIPPRDPLDVLEGKIRGRVDQNGPAEGGE